MEACNDFHWNKKYFTSILDKKINENRNFCVTLSIVNEKDDKGNVIDKPIITLKRWRRRRDSKNKLYYQPSRGFNIRDEKQFSSILNALHSYEDATGWKPKDIKKSTKYEVDKEVAKLINKNPETTLMLLEEIDKFLGKTKPEKIDFVRKALNLVGSIDTELMSFFTKLSAETPEAIKEMDTILDNLSLTQINAFTKYVHIRLQALEVFRRLITDKKTYELKGKKESMHRFLEDNSWILGEDYELLSSNKTLKTIIQTEVGKKLKIKDERDRPDFALVGLSDLKLVIVEIKKPGYSLKFKDADQLMSYKSIAEKYMGKKFQSFEGFLIGGKCDDYLEANKDAYKYIRIKTYTNIITKTEERYKELLKVYQEKVTNN